MSCLRLLGAAGDCRSRWATWGCLIGVIGLTGCRGPSPDNLLGKANATNIQRLANVYSAYQSRNDWRGPQDEADLRSFLQAWNPRKLTNIGVDPEAIDDLFISSRDGQPFLIRYGIPGHIMGSDAPVVFEATGVNGKRMVGFLNMTTREVDAPEYEQLLAGDFDPNPEATGQR